MKFDAPGMFRFDIYGRYLQEYFNGLEASTRRVWHDSKQLNIATLRQIPLPWREAYLEAIQRKSGTNFQVS
jgi:hypothetical protein